MDLKGNWKTQQNDQYRAHTIRIVIPVGSDVVVDRAGASVVVTGGVVISMVVVVADEVSVEAVVGSIVLRSDIVVAAVENAKNIHELQL